MKVYKVFPTYADYDDCEELIVIAENEDRVFKMTKKYFGPWQGDIHINEVDMTVEQIVL
jgi:hypothetical protein